MEKELESYKTICCEAGYYQKGRATYICKKCGGDVTMELLLVYQALETKVCKEHGNVTPIHKMGGMICPVCRKLL